MSVLGERVADSTTGPAPGSTIDQPAPVELDAETRATLLRIARAAVTATATPGLRRPTADDRGRPSGAARGGAHSVGIEALPADAGTPSPGASAALEQPGAAFVTLTERGSLRGCMGSLVAELPLGEAVASAAASAAVRDPRFYPVPERELATIEIAVSVLGPAVPLSDPASFRPGIDGIIVARDGRRALLLPEVASDQGWGTREMLDAVCEKAGLEGHAWHDPRTRLFVFRTVRVSESEPSAG